MLNGGTFGFALAQHRSALCVDHILGDGVNHRLAFQVDTLDLVTRILRGGIKCHCEIQARMQSLAEQGETAFQCFLLHLVI